MNRYQNKAGRIAVFHNDKSRFNTADGVEWVRCDTVKVVAAVEMPKGPAVLPPSTPPPATKVSTNPASTSAIVDAAKKVDKV